MSNIVEISRCIDIANVGTINYENLSNINSFLFSDIITVPPAPPTGGDRGINGGGTLDNSLNVLEYITISTTGNTQDFGDLLSAKEASAATSNG